MKSDLGFFRLLRSLLFDIAMLNSSAECDFNFKSLINLGSICMVFGSSSECRIVMSCLSGLVQEPPSVVP